MEQHHSILAQSVQRLLVPLVRLLLRYGVSYGAFSQILKKVYVEVANKEFHVPGKKQSISRVSILTGLNRKEVTNLLKEPDITETGVDERYNRAARVISGWLRDDDFLDRKGDPLPLPFDGELSFSELVRRYSGDMPPRAIADELERVGTLERDDNDRLRLTSRGYVPQGDEVAKLQILGIDTADLISTIEHNLQQEKQPRFQRKVSYDAVPPEHLEAFRKYQTRLSQTLLEELNHWLAEHDRDANPQLTGTGKARVGVGIYEFEEILEPADDESAGKEPKS